MGFLPSPFLLHFLQGQGRNDKTLRNQHAKVPFIARA